MKFNGRKDYRNINEIQREIDLLYKVKHPYLVQLLDHFEDENFEGPSYAYLVMEYVDGVHIGLGRKICVRPFSSLGSNSSTT